MQGNEHIQTSEEQVLLRFIRGESLAPVLASCRADELSRLAILHKIKSPLASGILKEEGIPPPWQRWALIATMASERDAGLSLLALKKTLHLLESGGISPVVLKGASLSLGKPRDAGDIDLLIPEASLMEAITLLETAGYVYKGYERNMHIRQREYRDWKSLARWSNQFEFAEPDTRALIELHTAFFETERVYSEDLSALRAAVGEFVDSSVVDAGTGYRFLALEDRALLLALHAGLKRSPVKKDFILRHVTDLRALIDAGLDWDRLEQRSFQFGAAHHLIFLLRHAASFAGPCAPPGYIEGIEAKLSPQIVWLQRLHLRCLRGLDSYDKVAIFKYRVVSPFILQGTLRARVRSLLVFPLFFPPRYTLERIYGLPPRSRLTFLCYPLEPVRWFLRLVRKVIRVL